MATLLEKQGPRALTALARVNTKYSIHLSQRRIPNRIIQADIRFFQTSISRCRKSNSPENNHPRPRRPDSKLYSSADDAVADLKDGVTILSAGFGLCGVAETLIEAINKTGIKNLTAVSNNAGSTGSGLEQLTNAGKISRMIMSYLGSNKELESQYLNGKVAIELNPQGTLAERIRAGGAGIPAFYTSTGVRTYVQTGEIPSRFTPKDETGKQIVLESGKVKETRIFSGKQYIMETALTGDVAILRAAKVDEAGNCQLRHTTKTYATSMAKAAKLTIVEAEEIVGLGELSSDDIDIPGIYIDRIVPATAVKQIENKKLAPKTGRTQENLSEHQQKRNRIAKRAARELKNGYYVNLGVGIPTLAATFVSEGTKVWLQSENGILGMGPYPEAEADIDPDLINASKETVTLLPGASTFDSAEKGCGFCMLHNHCIFSFELRDVAVYFFYL